MLDGVALVGRGSMLSRTWSRPSATVVATDATPMADASNTLAASARAQLSVRLAPGQDVDEAERLSLRHGDSFNMFVEWETGAPVRWTSIQPFGSATTRPASPHYTDQMRLYAAHRLKPVWFWRQDVLAHADTRETIGSPRR